MRKQTVVDQIEITRNGTIQLRLAKEVIDDDGSVLSRAWHRTMLPPGTDIDAQMALVNENLINDIKAAAVEQTELSRVKVIAPVIWTKPVTDAYAAKMRAENEAREAISRANPLPAP